MPFSVRVGVRIVLTSSVISLISILIAAGLTTPNRLGPFGITLWFGGLLIAIGGFLTFFLYETRKSFSKSDRTLIFATALRHGTLISTWLTALIALNSLRTLSLKDIVLVTILVLLIEFYLRRLK